MKSTLLLNASYEPLSVVPAKRAVTLILQEKAVSLDDSPVNFSAAHISIPVPYVARLNRYVKRGASNRAPSWTRKGVLVRDNYTCAYCGKYGNTIDHVIPQDAGGPTTYENCVTACLSCNGKKSNKFLKELGWSLNFKPGPPSIYENLIHRARNDEETYSRWSEYICMYDPSVKKKLRTA